MMLTPSITISTGDVLRLRQGTEIFNLPIRPSLKVSGNLNFWNTDFLM